MPSLTIENYVKTIYQICGRQDDRPAATGQVASALAVSPGTVTSMLKTLGETNLATYTPARTVRGVGESTNVVLSKAALDGVLGTAPRPRLFTRVRAMLEDPADFSLNLPPATSRRDQIGRAHV